MTEKASLGIDFGTSNSSVGSVVNGELKIVRVQKDRLSQPSAIYLDGLGVFNSVGYKALADFQRPVKPDNFHFVPSIKPALHDPDYKGISVQSKLKDRRGRARVAHFSTEGMTALVLEDLKLFADVRLGMESRNVLLGRPVRFSEDAVEDKMAQDRLEQAALAVGFEQVQFMYEPIAAGLHYERSHPGIDNQIIMVFDFGGGTLDTSCLYLSGGQRVNENGLRDRVLSSYGIDLGGSDLDKDVFRRLVVPQLGEKAVWGEKKLSFPAHFFVDATEWHLKEGRYKRRHQEDLHTMLMDRCSDPAGIRRLLAMVEGQHVYGVLMAIEQAKVRLSTAESADVNYYQKGVVDIHFQLNREEYEEIIRHRFGQVRRCVEECLKRANLKAGCIDAVVKVGGSSNNLFVDKLLRPQFDKIERGDIYNSVVGGLSLVVYELL